MQLHPVISVYLLIMNRDEIIREIAIRKEIVKRKARKDMKSFISYTMPDYQFNWHHEVMIKKLEAFARGEIPRLLVFMPPRHGKSQLVSRHTPAWIFGQNPDARIIACSYSADLASQMNRDVQRIMTSDEYGELFPESSLNSRNVITGHTARRNSTIFDIVNHRGHYTSAGVGGPITGKGADFAIIDDPIKNMEESESKIYRDKLWDWYVSTLYTRLEKNGNILITLTRWHEDDLAGRLLKQMNDPENDTADKWEVIDFPAICEHLSNQDDPRDVGEPLWPWKYDLEKLATIKSTLGSRYWTALYQQKPTAEGGNVIKGEWFGRFNKSIIRPTTINFYLDSAYTDKSKNDPSAIMAYFRYGNDMYILNSKTVRMGFSDLVKFIVEYTNSFNQYSIGYLKVEPKASGKDIVDYLKKHSNLNIIEDDPPKDDKLSRTYANTPYIEGGRVLIPEDDHWTDDFINELEAFPNGKHDDQVDCLNGAIKDTLKARNSIIMTGYSY